MIEKKAFWESKCVAVNHGMNLYLVLCVLEGSRLYDKKIPIWYTLVYSFSSIWALWECWYFHTFIFLKIDVEFPLSKNNEQVFPKFVTFKSISDHIFDFKFVLVLALFSLINLIYLTSDYILNCIFWGKCKTFLFSCKIIIIM